MISKNTNPTKRWKMWAENKKPQIQTIVRRAANGLCARCGKPTIKNGLNRLCVDCVPRESQRLRTLRDERKAKGKCCKCGKNPPLPERLNCQQCGERSKLIHQKRQERLKSLCLCRQCGKCSPLPSLQDKGKRYCEVCYLKQKAQFNLGSSTRWEILRDKLIEQNYRCRYSGEVLVLGVNDSIDHIIPVSVNSDLVYSAENVQWVSRKVNLMKSNFLHDEFLQLVKAIAGHIT